MERVSKYADKVLIKISKKNSLSDKFLEKHDNEITALIEHNYITYSQYSSSSDYQITDAGQAYLEYLERDFIRFVIPTTLSIIAIIISIAAIVLAPFWNAFFTKLYHL